MYKVLESFVTNTITGSKGETIKVSDNELASSLKKAGYITPISKKEQVEVNKDKRINELEKENATLKITNNDLLRQINELNSLLESETSNDSENKTLDKNDNELDIENEDTNEFIKDNEEDEELKDLVNK